MSTTKLTFNQAIDMAMEGATAGQRRRFTRRCTIQGYREKYVQELRDNLLDDPRMTQFGAAVAALDSNKFNADIPFAIDNDRLKAFLELILEYAPKFIDLVMLIMKLFMMLLLSLATSTGFADEKCTGGICTTSSADSASSGNPFVVDNNRSVSAVRFVSTGASATTYCTRARRTPIRTLLRGVAKAGLRIVSAVRPVNTARR